MRVPSRVASQGEVKDASSTVRSAKRQANRDPRSGKMSMPEQPDDSDSHSKIAAQESPHDTSSDVQWGVGGFSALHGPPTSTRLFAKRGEAQGGCGDLAKSQWLFD
ncbi:MAG TPA: hypothetical protein VGJ00_01985 [Rhabdochlamydiaceae bacterium]